MKLSIGISNSIAIVGTNVFPVGNATSRSFIVCTVTANSYPSLRLTNNHMAPVFNIADTMNLWVFIDKYKRPHCILILLSLG